MNKEELSTLTKWNLQKRETKEDMESSGEN